MKVLVLLVFCIICGIALASPTQKRRRMQRVLRSRSPVGSRAVTLESLSAADTDTVETRLTTYDRAKRSYDKWFEIISKYARPSSAGTTNPWQPVPIDLPVDVTGGQGPDALTLPLLVLPVPVPVPSFNQQCDSSNAPRPFYPPAVNELANDRPNDRPNGFVERNDVFVETRQQPAKVDVDYLIQKFREQEPRAPHLPPVLIGDVQEIETPRVVREYLPPVESKIPPQPKFDRSMVIKGSLTAYHADYTEMYMIWYDAETGAHRVDYHDESASSIQVPLPGGRLQRFVKHVDRSGDDDVRMCGVADPKVAMTLDKVPPGLPDPSQFTFEGFRDEFGGRVEVWTRVVSGRSGDLGAAPGESLTYRHELLVNRKADGYSVPLKYSMTMDSSVLGPRCDYYEHIYSDVKLQAPNPNRLIFIPAQECDVQEKLDANNPEHLARLDPLREFTLSSRDARYDVVYSNYIKEFERNYESDKEQALRKTLLIKNARRIDSCTRQSVSFQSEMNYLADRLDDEVRVLYGVDNQAEPEDEKNNNSGEIAPGSIAQMMNMKVDDDSFDWRELGGVTRVRNQGQCSSCWAMSTVGSVEGGYFKKTGKLVELSEQVLVDCGHKYGTKGCNGSWPTNAFEYIKNIGLPAASDYTMYQAMVQQCRDEQPPKVTKIQGHMSIPSKNIEALKSAIKNIAPVVVTIDTDRLLALFVKTGIYHDRRTDVTKPVRLNHAVLAVGWGKVKRSGDVYFYLKNSYGEVGGQMGYLYVHGPSNTAGFLSRPKVAIV